MPNHTLIYCLDGKGIITNGDLCYSFEKGESIFIKSDQSFSFNTVSDTGIDEFKVIGVAFNISFLQRYYIQYALMPLPINKEYPWLSNIGSHILIQNFFKSLDHFFVHAIPLSTELMQLKTVQILEILVEIDAAIVGVLFDFSTVDKVRLDEFMIKYYNLNVPLETFAKLTGREIELFRKDFYNAFGEAPGRWLLKKRLDLAYQLIKEKGLKPNKVYKDAGFVNLSHFSISFRKEFGINPSELYEQR
ncbi:AraC family transcriptional regulator [Chitinophaga sp.]|uniref:AraC family transcriptional regulator n=1 Tax=Chitinophaga sp. TaxID=1869181 RepID=UPI0039C8B13F